MIIIFMFLFFYFFVKTCRAGDGAEPFGLTLLLADIQ